MDVAVVVATFGDQAWRDLAWSRAVPSVERIGAETFLPMTVGRNYVDPLSFAREGLGWRLTIFPHHEPGGTVASARNHAARWAIEREAPEWLCFLDADDELDAGFFDAMAPAARRATTVLEEAWTHPPSGDFEWRDVQPRSLLVPSVQYVQPDGVRSDARIPNLSPAGKPRPLRDINRAVIGTLVPAAAFQFVGGFRDGYEPYEDWELWLRCERVGLALTHVPEAVYVAHVREESAHNTRDPRRQRDLAALYHRIRSEQPSAVA